MKAFHKPTNSLTIAIIACFWILKPIQSSGQVSDVVPDKKTAIKVAEILWLPMFGKSIYTHQPFVAVLVKQKGKDEYWQVSGTLYTDSGGVPQIFIRRKDCKILEIYHTK